MTKQKQYFKVFLCTLSLITSGLVRVDAKAQCTANHTSAYFYTAGFSTNTGSAEYTATSQVSSSEVLGYNDLSSDPTYNITQIVGGYVNFSHTYSGDYGHKIRIWVDWGNDDFTADDLVYEGEATSGYATITDNFSIPQTTSQGTYRLRIRSGYSYIEPCGSAGSGQTLDFSLVVNPLTTCVGKTLSAGTISLSENSANAGSMFDVSGTGQSVYSDLSFLWQKLPNAETEWQNVGTATSFYEPLTNQVAPFGEGNSVQYRLQLSCETEMPIFSNIETFTTHKVYCEPSYDNQGDYTDTFFTTGAITNVNYKATAQVSSGSTKGYNDLFGNDNYAITQIQGGQINFSHTYSGFPNVMLQIWIDYNDNGTFGDETYENVFSENFPSDLIQTGSFSIPSDVTAGTYRMRMRVSWSSTIRTPCSQAGNGQAIDFKLIVNELTECTGTPNAGTITVTPSQANKGESYKVTADGFSVNSGMNFTWEKTTDDGTTWQEAENSTEFYTPLNDQIAPELGTIVKYRLKVKCIASNDSTYSEVQTFTTHKVYCQPTFTKELHNAYIKNVQTDGAYQNLNNTDTGYGLNGQGFSDYTVQELKVNPNKEISFSVQTGGDNDYLSIWIDTSNNGTYESSELFFASAAKGTMHSTNISTQGMQEGTYRIRIMLHYLATDNPCVTTQYGEAEEYTLIVKNCFAQAGEISAQTYELCKKQTLQFTASKQGGTWKSKDGKIATIDDNGLVKAIDNGETQIIYIIEENECTDTVKQTIYVHAPTVVTINESVNVVIVGQKKLYTATPANGTWSVSDTTIATIDKISGELKALKAGKVTITYTVNNSAPCEGTVFAEKEITVAKESASSVEDINFISELSVFPNPASDKATIKFSLIDNADVTIELFDITGTLIQKVAIKNAVSGQNNSPLNVNKYKNGLYTVVVRANDTQTTTKLLITK